MEKFSWKQKRRETRRREEKRGRLEVARQGFPVWLLEICFPLTPLASLKEPALFLLDAGGTGSGGDGRRNRDVKFNFQRPLSARRGAERARGKKSENK